MQHNELRLINLYISLKVAKAKARLFKDKEIEVPNSLMAHIRVLRKEIMERENGNQ
jgi:hypothetical protein